MKIIFDNKLFFLTKLLINDIYTLDRYNEISLLKIFSGFLVLPSWLFIDIIILPFQLLYSIKIKKEN
jgi:hypothetical protein